MPVTLSAKWRNGTATSQVIADPGTGYLRCDATTLTGVTRLALSTTDATGLDATPFMTPLTTGAPFMQTVEWLESPTIVTWHVTAAPIAHGTWFEVPVTAVSTDAAGQGAFFEPDQMILASQTIAAAALAIGAVVTNGQPYQLVVAGTRALVVATGPAGALLVFQDGTQDWFDDAALTTYALTQIASAPAFAGYGYVSDLHVHEDFRGGFFDPVLTNPAAAAAARARRPGGTP